MQRYNQVHAEHTKGNFLVTLPVIKDLRDTIPNFNQSNGNKYIFNPTS